MYHSNSAGYMQISKAALRQNAITVTKYVGVPVIGVVKCDGYGVSLSEAAKAWRQAGVSMFAVSKPHEALELRQMGFEEDILLMSPVADAITLNTLIQYNIILTITGPQSARFYHQHASGPRPLRVHIAVDTGMGRFGIKWSHIEQLKTIYDLPGFAFEGIFSHFSKSFEKTYHDTKQQLKRFLYVTDALCAAGYHIGWRHIANSCAALRFPQTRLDAVRIGSALVGKVCRDLPISLHPVALFKAQVLDIKTLQPGDTTGYASVCRIKRYTKAIVVAIGYEDGFGYQKRPDIFGLRDILHGLYHGICRSRQQPYVLHNDTKLPLIGRIGNQFTLFDATNAAIKIGEYVQTDLPLFFPYHRQVIAIDE